MPFSRVGFGARAWGLAASDATCYPVIQADRQGDEALAAKLDKENETPAKADHVDDDDDDEDEDKDDGQVDVDAAINALTKDKESKRSRKILKRKLKDAKDQKRKAKAKAKPGQVEANEDDEKATLGLEECDEFGVEIQTKSQPPESRAKHCLDDFLSCLIFAKKNLTAKVTDAEAVRTKKFLVSLFLELAFTANVAVNGKIFKVYSTFREESQKIFVAAHQKLRVGKEKFDPLQLAKDLMSMVSKPVPGLSCSFCYVFCVSSSVWIV